MVRTGELRTWSFRSAWDLAPSASGHVSGVIGFVFRPGDLAMALPREELGPIRQRTSVEMPAPKCSVPNWLVKSFKACPEVPLVPRSCGAGSSSRRRKVLPFSGFGYLCWARFPLVRLAPVLRVVDRRPKVTLGIWIPCAFSPLPYPSD